MHVTKLHVNRLCGPEASPDIHLHADMSTKLYQVNLACAEAEFC